MKRADLPPKGLVPGQGKIPTNAPAPRPRADKELVYWGNQHGQGIVIKGDLARKIALACELTGESPEEFVMKAIETWSEKNEILPSSSV